MDMQNESSALEFVEDNELISSLDSNQTKDKVETNGSCSNEIHNISTGKIAGRDTLPSDGRVKAGAGIEQAENSENLQPLQAQSPVVGPSPLTKGYGLRKWRRIKRDVVKDSNPSVDSEKVLKRVLSLSGNPIKATNLFSAEIKQNSEGSAGSVNMLRNMVISDGLFNGCGMESRFAAGSAFALGTDSENTGDRSSKSSTAASAPRLNYDRPAVLGYMREKNMIKNLSGNSANSSAQRVQQGKGWEESSKKPRGERIKIEKENSHSSIESDSRSSNFVFMQGACSVTSNGNKFDRSMYHDGENSDEAHAGERQVGEEVQADDSQENVRDVSQDELAPDSSWMGKEEKSKNHRVSSDEDPLVESILNLQSVQEALQSEVQHLQEIGKVCSVPVDSTLFDQGIHESNSPVQFDAEKVRQSSPLESQVLSLTENVKCLESRLEEAETMIKMKELRVAELESTLLNSKLPREQSENTVELQHENFREIEIELEGIYKKKVEAEVEYLTLLWTMEKLRVATGDQITLFEQQEALAGEQAQTLNKLREAEKKASMLKKQAKAAEKFREDILGTEEVLKMQRRLYKVMWCFCIQLVLLFLIILLVVLQLSPHTGVVVPT